MALILCIEDEKAIRDDIVAELRDAGYQTVEASSGQEGLRLIVEAEPDLVLSDVTMPNMDGYQLFETLRAEHPALSMRIPFMFLTALADQESGFKAEALGTACVLTKPIDYDLLLDKVGNYLNTD